MARIVHFEIHAEPPDRAIKVTSVDDHTRKAEAAGGMVVLPKMPIPGVGWLAYCKDPEGNIFGLMQTDPQAA